MTKISSEGRRKLEKPFVLLADRLRDSLKNRRMIFMQNPGNWGDALIRYGTLKFFEDLKLEFKEFDMGRRSEKLACVLIGLLDRMTDQYLFVYGGNGNWAKSGDGAYVCVRRQRRISRNIFLLPTTFERHTMNIDFPAFARDQFQSKDFLKDGPFCHDMAFYLALISPDRVLPNRKAPTKKIGFVFRTDYESKGHGMDKWALNHDISGFGNHQSDAQEFLRRIDDFEHLVTDRLHVAIGGALLNKKVTVISGNYFKISAIYNSSLKGIFDDVEFIDNPSPSFIEKFRKSA